MKVYILKNYTYGHQVFQELESLFNEIQNGELEVGETYNIEIGEMTLEEYEDLPKQ